MRFENFKGNEGINENLIVELREYIKIKTGKLYFRNIKKLENNIMITCPFHKDGQERKPSCGIRISADDRSVIGTVHCFTCGETMSMIEMLQRILGSLYDYEEIEKKFNLSAMMTQYSFIKPKPKDLFTIPAKLSNNESTLRCYRYYHPYLESRGITEQTAAIYDIGYDKLNDQITFPIRDINKNCIGIGRRSIKCKRYEYPAGMVKPVYGVYELPKFVNYLYVVEGPFNLWSLSGWKKSSVALLGTGTETQYNQLLNIKCNGYVLALDPDDAGRKGIHKLAEFLIKHRRYNILVLLLPDGKDVNDLTHDEFNNVYVIPYSEWKTIYKF